jgi:hypothetical protein
VIVREATLVLPVASTARTVSLARAWRPGFKSLSSFLCAGGRKRSVSVACPAAASLTVVGWSRSLAPDENDVGRPARTTCRACEHRAPEAGSPMVPGYRLRPASVRELLAASDPPTARIGSLP